MSKEVVLYLRGSFPSRWIFKKKTVLHVEVSCDNNHALIQTAAVVFLDSVADVTVGISFWDDFHLSELRRLMVRQRTKTK